MSRRIAVITGGLGGLGTAFCRHLARQGCSVIAADIRNSERAEEWRKAMADLPGDHEFRALDVTDYDACEALVSDISSGNGGVDILVNGAGITRDVTMKKMAPEQWRDVLTVNLDGAFHMARSVVPGMTERGFGRIINISSVNGQTGQFGQTNYSAAKAGMHGMTMALAREVAKKGVTVNSISPGYCETQLVMKIPEPIRDKIVASVPVGRLGSPDEIARVVAFLAHDDSGYITGANIPVNGGYFMSF